MGQGIVSKQTEADFAKLMSRWTREIAQFPKGAAGHGQERGVSFRWTLQPVSTKLPNQHFAPFALAMQVNCKILKLL